MKDGKRELGESCHVEIRTFIVRSACDYVEIGNSKRDIPVLLRNSSN